MKKNPNSPHIIDDALSLMDSDQGDAFIMEFNKSLISAVERTRGIYMAKVESAVALEESEKALFSALIHQIFKSNITISFLTKAELLAGFRIIVGDWKLDASVQTQLNQMRKVLSERN